MPARRAFSGVGPATVAILAVASALVLAGCTTLGPGSRDTDTAAPGPGDAGVETVEPKPESERAATEEPEPALEIAVLEPADYERGIERRKLALASELDEPPSATDTGYYMDVQEAELRQALNGSVIGLFRENPDIRLRIAGTGAFETGGAQLNPALEQPLARVADVLEEYRLTLVIVHGHTDAAGDSAYNQHLSEERALAVARRLVDSGLEAERVLTVGHGELRPLAHETSPRSRWPSRRIDIELELISR